MLEERKLLKLKIIHNVGRYSASDEPVMVPEPEAEYMIQVRKRDNGHGLVDYRPAMLWADYEESLKEVEKRKHLSLEKGGFTQDELEAMGHKNIVPTPEFELNKPFMPGYEEKVDQAGLLAAKEFAKAEPKSKAKQKAKPEDAAQAQA